MHKTLSDTVADASGTHHKLQRANDFLRSQRWTEGNKHLRILMAIVKVWDEGGGTIDDEVLANRFGIAVTDVELDQAVGVLAKAGLLERLKSPRHHSEGEETISVSAKGLNLANELSWRRSEALLGDDER
jgi:hypothetical protein